MEYTLLLEKKLESLFQMRSFISISDQSTVQATEPVMYFGNFIFEEDNCVNIFIVIKLHLIVVIHFKL